MGFSVRLLGAFLGKEESGNPASIGLVMNYLENNYTENELLQLAVDYVYGDASINAVIEGLYTNINDEPASLDFVTQLSADLVTAANVAQYFVDSVENAEMVGLMGLNATGVDYLII